MLCVLATLLTVPVLLSSGASSEGEEVAVVAVADTSSASDLEPEIEIDELFSAGARVESVPDAPVPDLAAEAARQLSSASRGSVDAGTLVDVIPADPQQALLDEAVVEAPASAGSAPSTPTTTPPTTTPPTTAPTTAPPTTAPATTAPPETSAPETTTTLAAETPQAPEAEAVPTEAPATPTQEQWAALRQCESSGNYSIVSSNGRYHGAYQFYQPTWDGIAAQAGRGDLVGLPPSQATPADQDALALLLWQQRGSQPWPICGRFLPAGP
jgi:hypothetical protein